ncbi:fumarylacetoacetate hydrolase family protein [Bacillus sp. FJAT-45350]|uniref:fumarylacetoacetate hydrolase family protein n=1 Tax=Bacillus sp. FJAT-45350 TaxID=2011014 RepID=UPI000BB807CF|nr:fumarylacetoacetate hydrolase family protein [Bacillus sp. FJAT-45350]
MSKAKIKYQGIQQTNEVVASPNNNTFELNGDSYEVTKANVDSPVSGTIYGALLNYKGALASLGNAVNEAPYNEAPKAPILYIKPVNTISSYGTPIPLPAGFPEVEIGASLGIVIGRNATRVTEDEALSYVAGYTIVNDVSIPHDSVYRPAISQKARDGFCPVGPWVIERDSVTNPDALGIKVFINDELKQENNTSNLVRSVSRLLADVTDFMTLSEGDVLLVGVPENAPLAKDGDIVRIEIDGIGQLENSVKLEQEITKGASK